MIIIVISHTFEPSDHDQRRALIFKHYHLDWCCAFSMCVHQIDSRPTTHNQHGHPLKKYAKSISCWDCTLSICLDSSSLVVGFSQWWYVYHRFQIGLISGRRGMPISQRESLMIKVTVEYWLIIVGCRTFSVGVTFNVLMFECPIPPHVFPRSFLTRWVC